jgi:hypothetical protein
MEVKVENAPEKKVARFPKLMQDEFGNIILFNARGVGIAIQHRMYSTGAIVQQKDILPCTDFEGKVTLSN